MSQEKTTQIQEYHLNRHNPSKIHFQCYDAEAYLKKNWEPATKAHRHSYYQILWFDSPGTHYVDFASLEHPASALFLIKPGQVHYFCPHSPNKGQMIHFNTHLLQSSDRDGQHLWNKPVFLNRPHPYLIIPENERPSLQRIVGELAIELHDQKFLYGEQIYHLLSTLLLRIERALLYQSSPEIRVPVDKDPDYLSLMAFLDLLETYLDKFYTVQEYSQQLHLHPKKLNALTRRFLGHSPAQLIQDRKVLEAKRLLSNSRLSVKEVGYTLGFEQATYFSRYFKKQTGNTPKEFREALP